MGGKIKITAEALQSEVERLVGLSALQYQFELEDITDRTGLSKGAVDKLVRAHKTATKPPKIEVSVVERARLAVEEAKRVGDRDKDWRDSLSRDAKGRPKGNLANAVYVLSQADEWRGVLALDAMRQRTIINGKVPPWAEYAIVVGGQKGDWTNMHDLRTTEWLQNIAELDIKPETVHQAVEVVASENRFHPVLDYLQRLKWDGTERLPHWLHDYMGAEETNYVAVVGEKWLISAVARVVTPGCKADHMLIFEGKQGKMKSTALRILTGAAWFTDELADVGSKDAAMQLAGAWIVEMAELDVLGRADVKRIRAFLTRQVDKFRPPYGHRVVEQPRQCVFAGTANDNQYLRDETGNRRFWPVACEGDVRIDLLAELRDQLWAEAYAKHERGDNWWLTDEEDIRAAGEEQAGRYDADVWQPIIETYLALSTETSVTDVIRHALKLGLTQYGDVDFGRWSASDQARVARCLKAMKWERKQVRDGEKRTWIYRKPAE